MGSFRLQVTGFWFRTLSAGCHCRSLLQVSRVQGTPEPQHPSCLAQADSDRPETLRSMRHLGLFLLVGVREKNLEELLRREVSAFKIHFPHTSCIILLLPRQLQLKEAVSFWLTV